MTIQPAAVLCFPRSQEIRPKVPRHQEPFAKELCTHFAELQTSITIHQTSLLLRLPATLYIHTHIYICTYIYIYGNKLQHIWLMVGSFHDRSFPTHSDRCRCGSNTIHRLKVSSVLVGTILPNILQVSSIPKIGDPHKKMVDILHPSRKEPWLSTSPGPKFAKLAHLGSGGSDSPRPWYLAVGAGSWGFFI